MKQNLGLLLILVAILIAGAFTVTTSGCQPFTLMELLEGEEP